MQSAYPNTSLVPVRKMPAEKSEMTTQILFGQEVEIVESLNQWVRVMIKDDKYGGWADRKMFSEGWKPPEGVSPLVLSWYLQVVNRVSGVGFLLPPGSKLYGADMKKKCFDFNGSTLFWEGSLPLQEAGDTSLFVCTLARRFLGTPYLWGGKNPLGMDCSGLVQLVFAINGITLPRDAGQQAAIGKTVGFVQQARPADLAFFGNNNGNITHVGIITGKGSIVHASGRVREDILDQEGIYQEDTDRYSHSLKLIKRIVE